MDLIARLDLINRARELTAEESNALADAVWREKVNAQRRARYARKAAEIQARIRDRYAADPEYRAHKLAIMRASYHRRKGK